MKTLAELDAELKLSKSDFTAAYIAREYRDCAYQLQQKIHSLEAQFAVAKWLLEDLANTENIAGIMAQQALRDIEKMGGGE